MIGAKKTTTVREGLIEVKQKGHKSIVKGNRARVNNETRSKMSTMYVRECFLKEYGYA